MSYYPSNMSDEKRKEFDALYESYWRYVYKWEVGHEEDFDPNMKWPHKFDCNKPNVGHEHLDPEEFNQQCYEHGMMIKVNAGY